MKLKQWIPVLFLVLGTTVFSGCALFLIGAGVAAGAGGVAYVNGELKVDDSVTVDRAWSATQAAVHDLQFKVTSSQKDAFAGTLVSLRADNTKVVIHLVRQTDQVTEVRIRIGIFGDEALSRLVYDKIKSHY